MLDRLIFAVVFGTVGVQGLLADTTPPPPNNAPLTPAQLRAKGLAASKSEACREKKKSEKLEELCKRWEKQRNA
jgi:hypothetical protein